MEGYQITFTGSGVPGHNQEALTRYIVDGVPTGGFLRAVLSNDLRGAFEKADHINSGAVRDIVVWLFNHAPMGCWGSPEAVQAWIEGKGLKGRSA